MHDPADEPVVLNPDGIFAPGETIHAERWSARPHVFSLNLKVGSALLPAVLTGALGMVMGAVLGALAGLMGGPAGMVAGLILGTVAGFCGGMALGLAAWMFLPRAVRYALLFTGSYLIADWICRRLFAAPLIQKLSDLLAR